MDCVGAGRATGGAGRSRGVRFSRRASHGHRGGGSLAAGSNCVRAGRTVGGTGRSRGLCFDRRRVSWSCRGGGSLSAGSSQADTWCASRSICGSSCVASSLAAAHCCKRGCLRFWDRWGTHSQSTRFEDDLRVMGANCGGSAWRRGSCVWRRVRGSF